MALIKDEFVPNIPGTGRIGTLAAPWGQGHFGAIRIGGELIVPAAIPELGSGEAGEPLEAGRFVRYRFEPADLTRYVDLAQPGDGVVDGFVLDGYLAEAAVIVYPLGRWNSALGGLAPGTTYYLAADGTITDDSETLDPSDIVREIGLAVSATELITIAATGPTEGASGESTGDVVGPASATDGNFSKFSGTGGKTIADSGYGPASFATAAQGAAATAAKTKTDHLTVTQPVDLDAMESKLANVASGAEVNVQSDWNASSGDAHILNKPTLGSAAAQNTSAFDAAGTAATRVENHEIQGDTVHGITGFGTNFTQGEDLAQVLSTTGLNASTLPYTPATLSNWTDGLDPGNTNGALDQIATRVTAVEATPDPPAPLTLGGTPDYITLADNVLTRNQIDLTTDVTGVLPIANIATGTPDGSKFVRDDGTLQSIVSNATHTGDVTGANELTIANNAVTFAKIQTISSHTLMGRHGGGTGNTQEVSVGNGIEFHGSGIRRAALTGDVTATAGSNATTIANGAVTEAKCNSSINASLDLADSSIQPGNAALTDARTPTAHSHGNLSNDGKVGTTSGLPIKTGTEGVVEAGAFGTGSGEFAQGNDSRFGKDLVIVTDATAAVTLDGTNCYPDYIRCTSASAVTLTLAAGQSAAVGRHWIIRQAAAGVATVSANDSTPDAITRNGDPSTAGQHTEIAVILVADGVLDIVGGAA